MQKLYVQYGCGLSAPLQWENFDISPTLRIQKLPIFGGLVKGKLNVEFPGNVKYGDIIKGLPFPSGSCDGIYCSHTLEHLSFNDCKTAIKNTYDLLKPGGIFRCVVPDLESSAREYVRKLDSGDIDSGNQFIRETLLGIEKRQKGLKNFFIGYFGNSHHLWMWDKFTLENELKLAGFSSVRLCVYNDSKDDNFAFVEDEGRFFRAVAFEAIK